MQQTSIIAAAAVSVLSQICVAVPTITILGQQSRAGGLSANGSVIAGGALAGTPGGYMHLGRWTATGGFQDLGLPTQCDSWRVEVPPPTAVSPEGSAIAWFINYSCTGTFKWSESTGLQPLLPPPEAAGRPIMPVAISGYGGLVLGSATMPPSIFGDCFAMVLWPLAGSPIFVPPPPDCDSAIPKAVTPDGNVIVGTCRRAFPSGLTHAFRWTSAGGYEVLQMPSGYYLGTALSVSPDGSTIYGWCQETSAPGFLFCRWTNGIFSVVHDFREPHGPQDPFGRPIDASWDGKVVVTPNYIWIEGQPSMQGLFQFCVSAGIQPPPGSITKLSLDGTCFIGDPGYQNTSGAFVIRGLIDSACAADFNNDGVVDFFDYLDFVDAFSIGC